MNKKTVLRIHPIYTGRWQICLDIPLWPTIVVSFNTKRQAQMAAKKLNRLLKEPIEIIVRETL